MGEVQVCIQIHTVWIHIHKRHMHMHVQIYTHIHPLAAAGPRLLASGEVFSFVIWTHTWDDAGRVWVVPGP